jgi:3-deoxy-D-manno-octulosonic-acid transferase
MSESDTKANLPADARRSLFVYNLFFPLALIFLLPGLLGRMLRRGGFKTKFGQRLGRYSASDRARFAQREWIWIQSISVGETFVALKLAHALHRRDSNVGILLSTTTSTGFAEAKRAASDWLEPIYNPIDTRAIVRRSLDALQPRQLIIIEGGVWPNLVNGCRTRGIPVSLVNARLSPRSERRFRRFRAWTGPIFRMLDRIVVPEPEDIARWESLGVDGARLICTGSIKFDNPAISGSREVEFRELLAPLGVVANTPILLGGSTWAPEEEVLAETVQRLRLDFPSLFLILVPRHVERAAEIIRLLEPLDLSVVRRSDLGGGSSKPADVLLVDTTGELRDWYALACVVFIGKSLPGVREVGGQNPAEPAVLGKGIVFGPHMENFATLVGHLLSQNAAVQVPDAAGLTTQIHFLLRDTTYRAALGERARGALATHSGATERACEAVCGA